MIVEKIGIFDKLISQTKGSVIFYVGNDFQWNGTILVHQDTKVTWVPFLRETVNAVIAQLNNTKYAIDFMEI
ncbi:MAG: hypothetical protein J6Q11_05350 [Fibrobacteraceae bacterium]|nr:hypothetical protein [Fibrobacteraceae bacterium]